MAQISTTTWNEVANSNNAATPDGWPEGQAPSSVNNCAREMMSAVKIDFDQRNPTVTSGGSANTQTLTYSTAPTAYARQTFSFIAGFTNTGATTLNVNSVGALNVFMDNAALTGGEIVAGSIVQVVHDGTQFQITSSRAPGALPVHGQNLLINGDGEIWQRGAGGAASIAIAAASAGYTADCWLLATNTTQASTVSQQAGLTNSSRYCIRVQRNSGQTGTAACVFQQPLTFDQVFALRGQIITISCKARSGANFSPTSGALVFALNTGTTATETVNGSLTGLATAATVTTNLGTSSAVTPITATSSSVVPTNAAQGALIFSYTPTGTAGTNDYFEIDEIQLEIGAKPTVFDRRLFADEMVRCQRFYWKSFPYATAPAQNAGNTAAISLAQAVTAATAMGLTSYTLPARMRTAGSATLFNPGATNGQVRNIIVGADCSASSIGADEATFRISATSAAGSSAGNSNLVHVTIDSGI